MEKLKEYATCELVEELKSRAGVKTHTVAPYDVLTLPEIEGAATVFVVID